MAKDPDSREAQETQATLEQLTQAISGSTLGEIEEVLGRLLAARTPLAELFARTPPPSRRRPRRAEVVTYRVRINLKGTKPPLWRRLELASDLFLDQIHEIIQAAFGWTGSHLHHFGSGPSHYGPETEHYLCPFQVEEGETGIPEEDVRLDEVLTDPGDRIFYDYDFGDDWQHVIKLEAVVPRGDSGSRAVCVAGRRDGPPEDCGGVYAYELISAATDLTHPGHADAAVEFGRFYGDFPGPEGLRPTPFDIDEINGVLGGLDLAGEPDPAAEAHAPEAGPAGGRAGAQSDLPAPLDELVRAVPIAAGRRELSRLIHEAQLERPVLVDAATATRMVRPYTWLLNRVGNEGIKLTGAGYLPPVHVAAAMSELGLGEEWIGKGNRENQTAPVLHLRESAQAMGLLHKRRGMLLLTSRARGLRADPVALWWHLAERMPPASQALYENQAGLILLIVLAAQSGDPDAIVARLLSAIGWMNGDGTELDDLAAGRMCWDTGTVLWRLGAFSPDGPSRRSSTPTADGVTFARAALRNWPRPDGSRPAS